TRVVVLPSLAVHVDGAGGTMQAGHAAQDGGLAAARRAEQGGHAPHRRIERNVEGKLPQGVAQGDRDRRAVHVDARPMRFSMSSTARMTAKENTSMPPARMCACVHCRVST